jgi:hypothetical protein
MVTITTRGPWRCERGRCFGRAGSPPIQSGAAEPSRRLGPTLSRLLWGASAARSEPLVLFLPLHRERVQELRQP